MDYSDYNNYYIFRDELMNDLLGLLRKKQSDKMSQPEEVLGVRSEEIPPTFPKPKRADEGTVSDTIRQAIQDAGESAINTGEYYMDEFRDYVAKTPMLKKLLTRDLTEQEKITMVSNEAKQRQLEAEDRRYEEERARQEKEWENSKLGQFFKKLDERDRLRKEKAAKLRLGK